MNQQLQPVYDEVSKCNRCGFCQAHCPIFEITGDERNVARGHNVHVRKLAEGSLEISEDFKDPLFECLLCKACVANCFPAVRTDKSVIAGRAEYMKRVGQPKVMHFLFHRLLPDPDRLSKYVRLAALGKNSGMTKLARAMGILNWFGKDLDKVEGIVEKLPKTSFRERAAGFKLEPANPKHQVAYFVGCGFNFVLPHVSESTLEVLVQTGAKVQIADNCCCGLPAYGYGDLEAAKKMARKNIEALEKLKADVVVTECGSCSAFLKDYGEIFQDDSDMKERAKVLAKKVKGFSEYMEDKLPASLPSSSTSGKVTYHDPCHMSRYQGVVKQPRALLKKISGLTYTEMPEADRCCGAAGSYNVMHYEQSMKVLDRKMENLKKTGADILTTECPGCIIQLSYGVRRAGLGVRVLHLSELIREVHQGNPPGPGKSGS
jgi:glycolate oxidase iron-sulfur subunit